MEGIYDHLQQVPEGWQRVRLGDEIEVIRGASPRPKADPRYFGGKIPWIMISDVTKANGKFISNTRDHVTEEGAKKSRYLKAGTLILSNSGTVCVPKILAADGCIHDGFVGFPKLPERFDILYLYYFFEFIRPRIIDSHRQGITQVNLNTSIVKDIRIPIPPPEQQKQIVAEIEKQFSRLDEAVANLKRVKANLKRYKAAVLKAAVEGKLTEEWRKAYPDIEPASELLKRILAQRRAKWNGKGTYKEPAPPDTGNLSALPTGWCWVRLEQLGFIFGGFTKNPQRTKLPRKLPYIRVANVYANELRLNEIEEIGVEEDELDKLLLHPGDLLVVEGNGSKDQIGRLAIWDGSISPCVHQNHIIKVRLLNIELGKWILFWLLSLPGRNFVEEVASSTSGLYTLSVNKVASLPILLPPFAEQQFIVEEVERRLSVNEEMTIQLEANLKRVDRLRQSILQRAFNGNLLAASSRFREPQVTLSVA